MADAYIPGFTAGTWQVVLDKLWEFIAKEVGLMWNSDAIFKRLERTVIRVQAMLDDIEHKGITHKAWKIWMRDLKNATDEAEDLLDEISIISNSSSSQKVNMSSFPSFEPHKMDNIQRKVEEIAREMEYLLKTNLVGSTMFKFKERPSTSSLLLSDENSVFGREDNKNKIVDVLLSGRRGVRENVSVISVVGMAGIGKTTLAQIVYNDPRICKHFKLKMWVSVHNEFDVKRITKSIAESASERVIGLMDLDPLHRELRKYVSNKKFLLVLDDVWSENYNDWDLLLAPLQVGVPGSKILITTRSHIVSKVATSSYVQSLQGLEFDDCWSLFEKKAFGNINPADIPRNLKSIGENIVKKCNGVPLVAKTLGSLLYSVTSEAQWRSVLKSEIWDFKEDDSNILPALRLSYQYLPSHLKQCFAYCSVFPKGYKFEKEKLVLLWMAQGFVQAKRGRMVEDVGSDYFDDLMRRSFFKEEPADSSHPRRYLMHDLIHSLAKFISGEECFGMEVGDDPHQLHISGNIRHISFLEVKVLKSMFEALYRAKTLRTVFLSCEPIHPIKDVPPNLFVTLISLRALDLSFTRIEELPDSVGNLIHLRYLDLSMTKIRILDNKVCSLYSLQTLKLKSCLELLGLPGNLSFLTNLRHLDLQMNASLTSMPPSMGKLIGLQTLSTFIVGVDSGNQIDELKDLANLGGTLCILNLENVSDTQESSEAALTKKQYLRKLEFVWKDESKYAEKVLAGLQPHQNIEELRIERYGGAVFPSWIADSSLSNLVTLSLENCGSCTDLPPLGQLPVLKSLMVSNFLQVKNINESFRGAGGTTGFPSLEILKLEGMDGLFTWDGLQEADVPRLRELTISSCPVLTVLPNTQYFRALEHFKISDCPVLPKLAIEVVPMSLKSLIVNSCSKLRTWYNNEGRGDLKVIACNRTVKIDSLLIIGN